VANPKNAACKWPQTTGHGNLKFFARYYTQGFGIYAWCDFNGCNGRRKSQWVFAMKFDGARRGPASHRGLHGLTQTVVSGKNSLQALGL
jgi:hypothetical protein